eukprot:Gb_24398 [translate_table: standard]
MDRQETGEGKESFFGLMSSGSPIPSSTINGNPGVSRSGFKASEGPTSGFDFSSDDILSSYDYNNKQTFSDSHHNAPVRLSNSSTDGYMSGGHLDRFRDPRSGKTYANEQRQEDDDRYHEVVATVERTMKKYADNLLRVLDGMKGRLSQLELVNQRLERSVGELRADMAHNHSEIEEKFRFFESHIREVHRGVQILRDKQEIAEAQTELAKLQLSRKESSSNLPGSEDKALSSASLSEAKQEHAFQPQSVQMQHRQMLPSLPALPAPQHLTALTSDQGQPSLPQQQLPVQANLIQKSPATSLPQQQAPQLQQQPNVMEIQPYYLQQQGQVQTVPQALQSAQVPHIQQSPQQQQLPQLQHLSYMQQPLHIQNVPGQSAQPPVQRQQVQQLPQPQMPPQSLTQQPQLSQQTQMRPNIYSVPQQAHVQPHQLPQGQTHGLSPEVFSYSPEAQNQHTQVPYQAGSSGNPSEAPMYNYGTPGRIIQPSSQGQLTMQPPRPQHNQGGSQVSDSGSAVSGPAPPPFVSPVHPMHGYSTYNLPARLPPSAYSPQFSMGPQGNPFPGSYPRFPPAQQVQQFAHPASNVVSNSGGGQLPASHSFDELVEQVSSMGFSKDQVRSVIQRLTENGQPVDMNVVLDRLNSSSSGPSQRGWYN